MTKQDSNGVRTPQDLERKYNFSQLLELKKNYELQKQGINKVENELKNFVINTTKNLDELQNQVDGNITTWFYNGVPSNENKPANEWSTEKEKINHLGDLYYDQDTGYAYRWAYIDDNYQWSKIVDADVVKALAVANKAKDTADSKRRIFVEKPSPPYDCGDLWIKEEELYRCQTTKSDTEIFEDNDWIIATKYTDDTVANQVGKNLTILSGTVTEIRENVDELNTVMTNTTEIVNEQGKKLGTLEKKQTETLQTVDEISQSVSYIGKLEVDKDTYDYIHIIDAKEDELLNLTIYGNFGEVVLDTDLILTENLRLTNTYLVVDKSLKLSDNARVYELPDMDLNTGDKLIILNGSITIERQNGNIEELEEKILIKLFEGENYVYLQTYRNSNTKLHLKYKVENDYTKEYATKLELKTSIQETAKDIKATVSEEYYNKSTINELIEDTKNGLTNKYMVGGGNNLFLNTGLHIESTKYSSGYESWNGVVKRINNMQSKSRTSMLLQNGYLSQRQEVPNGVYTISFEYEQKNTLANATIKINDVDYLLETKGTFSKTIDTQTSEIIIEFICDINDGYEIYELMVNYGEVALTYSQNANETTTDTVQIGEGIKITSSTTNSTFKADSDGIRVENKSNNTTTEFLDTGMKTTNVEAGKGTIANLLIEEVDGQIWLVGLGR